MDKNVNHNVVTNEIVRLENDLQQKLKERTANAGIGLTNVSMPPEQELCQKLLTDGRPKAFVEFFHIVTTHEPEPTPKEDEEAGILNPVAEAQKTLKRKETQSILCNHLVVAEMAARSADSEKAFLAHSGAGKLFDETCYFETSINFYSRSLNAATELRNTGYMSQAKFNLGKVYWKMHEIDMAIANYEECLSLARSIQDENRIILAAQDLLKIYWHCAEMTRAKGDLNQSIAYFEKCVKMGEACGDERRGGEAKHNIGLLYSKLRNLEKSLQYQEEYLQLSRSIDNKVGECKAHNAMAESFETAGDVMEAIKHLNAFLAAAACVDVETQARGHCLLGMLYKRQSERELSLEHLEKYFEMSRILKEPDLLDVARVNIGIVHTG